ncbi:MAG: archaeosortase/exosortase family protein [Candidatus Micrarchaeota archaeon]
MVKITSWEKTFLVSFSLFFLIPFFLLYVFDFSFLTSFVAGIEAFFLGFFVPVFLDGSTIFAGSISFDIVIECTGAVMFVLLFALLYSTDAPKKIFFLLLFAPVLFVFNLLRLFLTLIMGVFYGVDVLNVVHFLLWFVDAGVVFLLWLHAMKIKPASVIARLRKTL